MEDSFKKLDCRCMVCDRNSQHRKECILSKWNRREWMAGMAGLSSMPVSSNRAFPQDGESVEDSTGRCPLALVDYQPRSMLSVRETEVLRARYPVIDFHTHLSFVRSGSDGTPQLRNLTTPEEALKVMERKNIRIMVNLTGGYGPVLEESLDYWQRPHPDRFLCFIQPWFDRIVESNYSQFQAEEIERAAGLGVRGIKVLKTLGLYLRERVDEGPLVPVDDSRFDSMWEAAGAHRMPIAIHTSDPEAFFLPIDRFNERFEELNAHPDWSFYGKDYPDDDELQAARLRVVARHPQTNFVALHVANAENLDFVSDMLDRYSNLYIEFGARIAELGRQPRRSLTFFDRHQDRIIFGTDAVPFGFETPQQIFGDHLYEIYYRFLETDDEYFDYAPADTPPQGRWKIYGLDLPEHILRKVYYENAARLLDISI